MEKDTLKIIESQDTNNSNINNNNSNNKEKKKKNKVLRAMLMIFLVMLLAITAAGGFIAGIVLGIVKTAPEIDPTNILSTLSESSVITDEGGNTIEKIHDPNENREIVPLEDMPKNLRNAFLSIEDHRFEQHFGIDIQRILSSLVHNFQVGDATAQGASTITQQLVKNLYLTNEKSYERKIKEIYLALKIERILSKEQILENYLNTIPLGQSSYGVQTAARTYFSKDAKNLTLAECAMLAGAAKSTVTYAPFSRYNMDDLENIPEEDIVGYVTIGSVQYACVYNQDSRERQLLILDRMLELGYISESEYNSAINEEMRSALTPGQTKIAQISTLPMDYVKEKVIEDLMEYKSMSYNEAETYLYRGGLTITTTIDVNIQKSLEESYKNFSYNFLGAEPTGEAPVGEEWRYFKWVDGEAVGCLDSEKNVLNEYGQTIFYLKENILDEESNMYLYGDEYSYDQSGFLVINSKKFDIYSSNIDIVDCYTINEEHNFVSHILGSLNIGDNLQILEQKGTKGKFIITKDFLDKNPDAFHVGDDNVLRISKDFFYYQENGIVQPQSAAVIMDYRTGKIKAMFGGRNIEGSRTFNRASDAARQPGSTIKPLSIYLPALNMGYSASYILEDLPRTNEAGERWPKNWFEHRSVKYWGKLTLRKSIEQSVNTNAVNMLEQIGTTAAIESLANLGFIDTENPNNDTFISPQEDAAFNDVNLASLGLGGLTKGFSPLAMTAAYGAIANDGVYVEPISYTKITDSNGEVILENTPETRVVSTPEAASLMKDILKTTVTTGLSYKAKLPAEMGIEAAGKTGTTQASGDFWYVGFTPYYISGVWVGNDNVQMKLTGDSGANANLWKEIMIPVHEGLEPAKFELNQNLIPVSVCKQSGLLPTEYCSQDPRGSQVITDYFAPGTVPSKYCETHVKAEICTNSNMLISPYCPGNLIEQRILVTRTATYDRSFSVQDDAYQLPLGVCANHTQWHYDQWINQQSEPVEDNNEETPAEESEEMEQ
jgi:penicillin-binding protein 1A